MCEVIYGRPLSLSIQLWKNDWKRQQNCFFFTSTQLSSTQLFPQSFEASTKIKFICGEVRTSNPRPFDQVPSLLPTFAIEDRKLSSKVSHLISDVKSWDILVDFNDVFCVGQEIENVGNGGWHPATALIEKLVETLRTSWNRKS